MSEVAEPSVAQRDPALQRIITVRMPGTLHRRIRELCLRVSAESGVVLSMNEFSVMAIERALEAFDGKANGTPRPLPNQTELFADGTNRRGAETTETKS